MTQRDSESYRLWKEIGRCAGLVALGVVLRWQFSTIPNFSPVAALALYAGFVISRRSLALLVPLTTMLITDMTLGGYDTRLMLVVYAMLAMPVAFGAILQRVASRRGAMVTGSASVAAALAGSVAFFVVTNFACWLWSPWYESTLGGLAACYAAALPFFRYTIAGDVGFTVLLFGSHAVAVAVARRPVRTVANSAA